MEQLALLDFCKTVVDFDTFDPFIMFVIKKTFPKRSKWVCDPIFIAILDIWSRFLWKMGITQGFKKRFLVRQVKGVPKDWFIQCGAAYYTEKIRGRMIIPTINFIKEHKEYRYLIVSGGSDFYIRCFAQEFEIADVISTQLEFVNGICTGKILVECIGQEKRRLLQEYMKVNRVNGLFRVGLADSSSDLPILELCQRKIIISHQKKQDWVTQEMEEIVWH